MDVACLKLYSDWSHAQWLYNAHLFAASPLPEGRHVYYVAPAAHKGPLSVSLWRAVVSALRAESVPSLETVTAQWRWSVLGRFKHERERLLLDARLPRRGGAGRSS